MKNWIHLYGPRSLEEVYCRSSTRAWLGVGKPPRRWKDKHRCVLSCGTGDVLRFEFLAQLGAVVCTLLINLFSAIIFSFFSVECLSLVLPHFTVLFKFFVMSIEWSTAFCIWFDKQRFMWTLHLHHSMGLSNVLWCCNFLSPSDYTYYVLINGEYKPTAHLQCKI